MRRLIVLTALVLFGCTAFQQQKAQAAKPDNLEFHNLKVLPQNITRPELIRTMRIFARSLGVHCDFCHVQTATSPKPEFDFASDAKEEKRIARTMIRMVRTDNADFVGQIKDRKQDVTCMTCHRGKAVPEVPVISGEAEQR
jgi:Photosynthetic reaction centre cytochrome C subunit